VVIRRVVGKLVFDLRHGVRTEHQVSLDSQGLASAERIDYSPSGWFLLRRALPQHETRPEDVFLDAGSGMGRIVLQAARQYRFARVIGVELAPELHRIAQDNLRRSRTRALAMSHIDLINADITDYTVPDDVTVVYLFNPFTGSVFQTFLQHLMESIDRAPRTIRIIYANPVEEQQLLATGRVQPLRAVRGRARTMVYQMSSPRDGATKGRRLRALQSVSDTA
jgi:hypothetical protein